MTAFDFAGKTDLCVKCGLCLPHCPTYGESRDENESPRGRLALIQGWAEGVLEATPTLTRHIDHCLLCRACEAACPARVPYGQIVDQFRAAVPSQSKSLSARLKLRGVRAALTEPRWVPRVQQMLAGPAAPTVRRLAGWIGLESEVAGLPADEMGLPPLEPGLYPAQSERERARVALFLGCTGDLLDRQTARSVVTLLTRLGIRVRIPERQGCCGALHWHGGERERANELISRNLIAFGEDEEEPILGFASGCGAFLSEYDQQQGSTEAVRFARRFRDIHRYLDEIEWPESIRFNPLKARILLHAPCSLRNTLRSDRFPEPLLKRIPELEVTALPATTACCGAAGSYQVEYPERAAALREPLLKSILETPATMLLTANPGCALHLRAGLEQRGGRSIEVIHPVTLLARQLA